MKWKLFGKDGSPVIVVDDPQKTDYLFDSKREAQAVAERLERLTGVAIEVRQVPNTHCCLCEAELSPYKGWIRRRCFTCGTEQP